LPVAQANSQRINTVTGPIGVDALGVTLMHEHLVIGFAGWESDTFHPGPSRREMIAICCDKIAQMQAHGIRSMVDPCPNDLGRDVTLAAEVAQKTGFNIVCATGLYKQEDGGMPYWHFRGRFGAIVDVLADLFIRELTVGVGDTGIKAGIIKVGSGPNGITAHERNVLQAAAIAAKATGAPITTHTDEGKHGDEQQAILLKLGVPAHQILIGHSCGTPDHDYHLKIVGAGSYLGFDRFGINTITPDESRLAALVALLKKRHEKRLFVSHDSVWCWRGEPFPDHIVKRIDYSVYANPTHLHRNIFPKLLAQGVTQQQIDIMLVDNPRRFFGGTPS
jgi:phosphotriesterase-related protein